MKASLRTNATASAIQVSVAAILLFATYRFVVQTLSVEQFGLWALVASMTSVARLGDLGFGASLSRFVAVELAAGRRDAAASLTQSTAVVVALLVGSVAMMIYWPVRSSLPMLVPPALLSDAQALLPYTALSLVPLVVGVTLGGALEGCQRFWERAVVGILGGITLLVACWFLVPRRGVVGIGMAQVIQTAVVAALTWLLVRRALAIESPLPCRLKWVDLRKVWSFSLGVQAISFTQLLTEPLAKIIVTRFGGLASTGVFELAHRVALQLRAPLVAACQVILPAVAGMSLDDRKSLVDLMARAQRRLAPVTLLAFGALLLSWPVISEIMLDRVEPLLIVTGVALTLAWGVNTLSAPSYFFLLGRGTFRWNLLGHIVAAVLTVMSCLPLGQVFGARGVAIGYSLAVVLGSAVAIAACQRQLMNEGAPLLKGVQLVVAALLVVLAIVMVLLSWPNALTLRPAVHG